MQRLKPFKLALMLGCGTEGVIVAVMAAFGRLGPCGPSDALTVVIMLLHLPGFLLAWPITALSTTRPDIETVNNIIAAIIIIGTAVMAFTGIFYGFIRWLRGAND